MNRAELKKLINGIPATVPTPFDDDYNLDLARMTDLTKWWVEKGLGSDVAPLKVAAAMGEGPELSDDELPHLVRTVVNAAGSGKRVMCALKPKNTKHTIEDAKMAEDAGAIGLQIDLPFFHHPNADDLVRFYTDISDAIGIGIMIYNTHWFNSLGTSMTTETMLRLKDAEHVVALKWSPTADQEYDEMCEFSDIFNVIDNTGQAVRCHKNGGRGYISGMIAVRPERDLAVWQLLEEKRYDEAQARIDEGKDALAPWSYKVGTRSGGYSQMKGLMAAIGLPCGPPRPPTLAASDELIAEAREIVKELGWVVN